MFAMKATKTALEEFWNSGSTALKCTSVSFSYRSLFLCITRYKSGDKFH